MIPSHSFIRSRFRIHPAFEFASFHPTQGAHRDFLKNLVVVNRKMPIPRNQTMVMNNVVAQYGCNLLVMDHLVIVFISPNSKAMENTMDVAF